ncbi:hypothetical protein KFK09_015702 [Dendrobium nobile]|uniref:Uncharacterized protein n=1 Tax=Dendrobium nobile TaxID=94219 RepID=A0A8T3B7M0_DENNO|nr:hypothetical protein KFK09_015702 [Dendrobium nobile]
MRIYNVILKVYDKVNDGGDDDDDEVDGDNDACMANLVFLFSLFCRNPKCKWYLVIMRIVIIIIISHIEDCLISCAKWLVLSRSRMKWQAGCLLEGFWLFPEALIWKYITTLSWSGGIIQSSSMPSIRKIWREELFLCLFFQ